MIKWFIELCIILVIVDSVLTFVPDIRDQKWAKQLRMIVDVPEKPIRKILPPNMPFDLSPLVVILVLRLLMVTL